MKTEKQQHPIVFDERGNPVAIVFFDLRSRDRIIYTLQKADDDTITNLIAGKSPFGLLKVISENPKTKPNIENSEIPE